MSIKSVLSLIIILQFLDSVPFDKVYAGGRDDEFSKNDGKLRVCIVEGRGKYRKANKYCPTLEKNSNIECVIGLDRLDCLRRISKGTAHFGVFSSEDLVAAQWAGIEILVTSEMRFHNTPFEYEIVAVVDNEAGINSAQDLRGSKLCHPGHGLQNHWTDILANYFESTLVARECEEDLSVTESRIKASANFFGPSCIAGPWVPDPVQDRVLKNRYPSLCEICNNPYTCGKGDKHWGRRGPLYCLTSGYGNVAWARLDDVKSHFGFSGLQAESNPDEYSFVCPDGHLQPINTANPCIWVAKPWPSIAAARNYAAQIQTLVERLNHDDNNGWEDALLSLLETYHVNVTSLDTTIPVNDYLNQAVGFQSAYSFPACSPPRSIVYCTTSIIQHYKCSWLQESSSVYGIEPNIQCIRSESIERCMEDTEHKVADVVLVDQDERVKAERDYHLKPLLYEHSTDIYQRYVVLAVVRTESDIHTFADLRGKRACFPNYEGAAYLSVLETLLYNNLTRHLCPYSNEMSSYFSEDSCTWAPNRQDSTCQSKYQGDEGALRCVLESYGDVAFLSSDIFKNFTEGTLDRQWARDLRHKNLKLLCPYGRSKRMNDLCYINWTPRGHLMINNETILMRRNDIYNSLRDMDRMFGKQYTTQTLPFTMYGPFDKKNNIMFRDTTDGLKGINELMKDKADRLMDSTYTMYAHQKCTSGSGILSMGQFNFIVLLLLTIIVSYRQR